MKEFYFPFQPILTDFALKRFGLSLEQVSACPALKGVIHAYLQIRTSKPTPYPVIPDGTQAIFISPCRSMIGGAQSQATDLELLQPGEYFGIWFYPGALRHFFELNLAEITNQYVDHQYFPCRKFAQLHNEIYRYQHFPQRARVCELWLLHHLKSQTTTLFDQALSLIYQSSGNLKIDTLATRLGWSSRHLNRLFRYQTGLSTKQFSQTIRLQHACRQLYLTPHSSLQTASDLGFYDQAHLLREYKTRLLLNPRQFSARFMSDFYNS